MRNPGIAFGLRLLVISIVWTLLEHFAGLNTTNHELGQYTRMIPPLLFYVFIFIAILKTKKDNDDVISLSYAFKIGLTVSLVYSIGICIWLAVYGELINPQYKPTLLAFERGKLEASGISGEQMAAALQRADLSSGGSFQSYLILFGVMFGTGLIVSLVLSLVLRTKVKPVS